MFNDSVSVAHGTGADICGARKYSIISAPTSATSALSTSELTIDPDIGLITLYTANSQTVGTHTATVSESLSNYPTRLAASQQFTIII